MIAVQIVYSEYCFQDGTTVKGVNVEVRSAAFRKSKEVYLLCQKKVENVLGPYRVHVSGKIMLCQSRIIAWSSMVLLSADDLTSILWHKHFCFYNMGFWRAGFYYFLYMRSPSTCLAATYIKIRASPGAQTACIF